MFVVMYEKTPPNHCAEPRMAPHEMLRIVQRFPSAYREYQTSGRIPLALLMDMMRAEREVRDYEEETYKWLHDKIRKDVERGETLFEDNIKRASAISRWNFSVACWKTWSRRSGKKPVALSTT